MTVVAGPGTATASEGRSEGGRSSLIAGAATGAVGWVLPMGAFALLCALGTVGIVLLFAAPSLLLGLSAYLFLGPVVPTWPRRKRAFLALGLYFAAGITAVLGAIASRPGFYFPAELLPLYTLAWPPAFQFILFVERGTDLFGITLLWASGVAGIGIVAFLVDRVRRERVGPSRQAREESSSAAR